MDKRPTKGHQSSQNESSNVTFLLKLYSALAAPRCARLGFGLDAERVSLLGCVVGPLELRQYDAEASGENRGSLSSMNTGETGVSVAR